MGVAETDLPISIHAPSRERLKLPKVVRSPQDFNPRSLAGATTRYSFSQFDLGISIHAPSRERLALQESKAQLS